MCSSDLRVDRSGDLSGSGSVQVSFSGGSAKGGSPPATEGVVTGPSGSASPYVLPIAGTGVQFKSVLTTGSVVGATTMAGIPDGLGAFDNGDGTFTLLMNHEIVSSLGGVRAHGGKGAFVSSWIINKADLTVVSGSDLIRNVYTWNQTTQSSNPTPNNSTNGNGISFSRFCSADLPPVGAFYNPSTGLGTQIGRAHV